MPAPVIPPDVASGELITSAWGNGVVDCLMFAPVQRGSGYLAPTALVNASTILHQAVPAVPYATTMFVVANGYGGSDSGAGMDGLQMTIQTQAPVGNLVAPTAQGASPASRYGHIGMARSWAVAANASAQFSLAVSWTSGTGTTYVGADLLWWQFRQ